jgi:hypothetical protein
MIFIVIAILIGHSRSREYCNSIRRESEDEVSKALAQNKRNDKTIEQHTQYLVNGIAVRDPEL